jgi:hypothetical protein
MLPCSALHLHSGLPFSDHGAMADIESSKAVDDATRIFALGVSGLFLPEICYRSTNNINGKFGLGDISQSWDITSNNGIITYSIICN